MLRTLAHLSDLHLGRSAEHDAEVGRVVEATLAAGIDHVIVSGDVTDRGRAVDCVRFERLVAPLAACGRLTVIPGNHDRLGDDVGARLRGGARVQTQTRAGLHVVRFDSTGEHNRFLLAGHGNLSEPIVDEIAAAVDAAAREHVVVVALHHHVLPQPEETLPERLSTRIGLPYATELRLGLRLLHRLRGRCDLVLHGHRHVPRALTLFAGDARPLGVYNAGCTPRLGRFRVFAHARGRLLGAPGWLLAREGALSAERRRTGTEDA